MDGYYVNILVNGKIPFLNVQGPLFGYYLPPGTYLFLKRAGVEMEITDPDSARSRRLQFYSRPQNVASDKKMEEIKKAAYAPKPGTEPTSMDYFETLTWTELRAYMDEHEIFHTRGNSREMLLKRIRKFYNL